MLPHESVHATSLGYPPPPTVTRLPAGTIGGDGDGGGGDGDGGGGDGGGGGSDVLPVGGDRGAGAGAPHVNRSDDEGPVLMHVSTGFTNGAGEVVPLGTVQSDVPVK